MVWYVVLYGSMKIILITIYKSLQCYTVFICPQIQNQQAGVLKEIMKM